MGGADGRVAAVVVEARAWNLARVPLVAEDTRAISVAGTIAVRGIADVVGVAWACTFASGAVEAVCALAFPITKRAVVAFSVREIADDAGAIFFGAVAPAAVPPSSFRTIVARISRLAAIVAAVVVVAHATIFAVAVTAAQLVIGAERALRETLRSAVATFASEAVVGGCVVAIVPEDIVVKTVAAVVVASAVVAARVVRSSRTRCVARGARVPVPASAIAVAVDSLAAFSMGNTGARGGLPSAALPLAIFTPSPRFARGALGAVPVWLTGTYAVGPVTRAMESATLAARPADGDQWAEVSLRWEEGELRTT